MVWSDEWESMKLYAMEWDFYAMVWEFNAMLWDSNTVLTYGVCCKIYARSDCNWFFLNALTQSVKNKKKIERKNISVPIVNHIDEIFCFPAYNSHLLSLNFKNILYIQQNLGLLCFGRTLSNPI